MNFFKDEDCDSWTGKTDNPPSIMAISVKTANRLLSERAQNVYGTKILIDKSISCWFMNRQFDSIHKNIEWSTHKALLINVEPIKKSPEDLAQEYETNLYRAGETIGVAKAYEAGYLRAIKDNKI